MNHDLYFAGHNFVTAGDAALFWPMHKILLVADLHLEKASSYAGHGQMLPPYDSLATLEELAQLAHAFDAQAVICLGDNFHDNAGEARLTGKAATLLRTMTSKLNWTWITGNHDPALMALWGGRSVIERELSGIMLRHQAEPDYNSAEISGHYHPKVRVMSRGRTIARRCFVASGTKLIFPAFGALTGGMDAAEAAALALALAQPALLSENARPQYAGALIVTPSRLARFTLDLRPYSAGSARSK